MLQPKIRSYHTLPTRGSIAPGPRSDCCSPPRGPAPAQPAMARLTILSALLLAGTAVAAGRRLQQEVAVECPESVLGCSACATTGTTLRCKACTTNAYMDAGGHCSECASARLVGRGGPSRTCGWRHGSHCATRRCARRCSTQVARSTRGHDWAWLKQHPPQPRQSATPAMGTATSPQFVTSAARWVLIAILQCLMTCAAQWVGAGGPSCSQFTWLRQDATPQRF